MASGVLIFESRSRSYRGLFRFRETWQRVKKAGAPFLLSLLILVLVGVGLFILLKPSQLKHTDVQSLAQTITAVAAAVGVLWAGSRVAARFLLWNSSRGARVFELSQSTPMAQIAEHFGWLVSRIDDPVVLVIDDLDRCSEDYVVDVLDAAQTLLRDAQRRAPGHSDGKGCVYVVVAADGAWIRRSYELKYANLADSISQPGRPLGYLFLDKLFQLSVAVPAVGSALQREYLTRLLAGDNESASKEDVQALREAVAASTTGEGVLAAMRGASPDAQSAVASDAIARLTDRQVEGHTEHLLMRFAQLVGTNPRAIKRFLNTYSMIRVVRLLEGNLVATPHLAAWTIIQIRWPGMAEILAADPSLVDALLGKETNFETLPEVIRQLSSHEEVAKVITIGELTPMVIQECIGAIDPSVDRTALQHQRENE
jgi:hypothetical protein